MSWITRKSVLQPKDWSLLDFEPRASEAFTISRPSRSNDGQEPGTSHESGLQTNHKLLESEGDLQTWLDNISSPVDQQNATSDGDSTINLIMASKTDSLDEIPFTQPGFESIMKKLHVHGSIVRAINRNTIPSIACWEGDMALSVTFFPDTLTTNAVWYGCDLSKRKFYRDLISDSEIITGQLKNFDGGVFHPLLLHVIFAGFERERHIGTVRKCLTQFIQRIHDLVYQDQQIMNESKDLRASEKETVTEKGSSKIKEESLASYFRLASRLLHSKTHKSVATPKANSIQTPEQEPAVLLWQNISFLRIRLQNWQTQLRKMIDQIQQLHDTHFNLGEAAGDRAKLIILREVGARLKTRLQDLVDEYDEYIRQCTHIMDGLTLATQLELNNIGREDARTNQEISRVNLEVAQMTRLDGSLMKSIATLGMVFLPATFVSTFFSMGFFQWTKGDEKGDRILSPYFWVYVVVAIGLTIFTMAIFYACALRRTLSRVDDQDSA
ncbi:hypothetical protein F53441_6720 [Fusarium austroafricanum]|uniref:Uncharacterized protein n=1 Tax=Fusarium austroafricanum TaxID=2364996 RepID=A0A8H4NZ89_9HYPO|nr:hypothetical protein F53441_6720 [Fusarium austroafricanum]